MDTSKTPGEIGHDRRRFLGTAALAVGAAQFSRSPVLVQRASDRLNGFGHQFDGRMNPGSSVLLTRVVFRIPETLKWPAGPPFE